MCVATTAAPCSAAARRVVGVGQPADVVAHHGALGKGGTGNRGAPGIDRDRRVEACRQACHDRNDAIELFGLGDLGSGARLHATDVEDVGAVGDELLGAGVELVELVGGSLVVEGVRRAIEDPHHQSPVGEVVAAPAQIEGRGRRNAGRRCHQRTLRTAALPVPGDTRSCAGRRSPSLRASPRTPDGHASSSRTRSSNSFELRLELGTVSPRDVHARPRGDALRRRALGWSRTRAGAAGAPAPPAASPRSIRMRARPSVAAAWSGSRSSALRSEASSPAAASVSASLGAGARRSMKAVTSASGSAPMNPSTTLASLSGVHGGDGLHLELGWPRAGSRRRSPWPAPPLRPCRPPPPRAWGPASCTARTTEPTGRRRPARCCSVPARRPERSGR